MDTLLCSNQKYRKIGSFQRLECLPPTKYAFYSKKLLLVVLLLCALLQVSIFSQAEPSNNQPDQLEYFIEFTPGNYQQLKTGTINDFLEQVEYSANDYQIKLIGYSESRSFLATESLAFKRANIVKKALMDQGIPSYQIKIYGEYENFKSDDELLHGVLAIVTPILTEREALETTNQNKPLSNNQSTIGFIAFSPAVYDREIAGEIDKLLPRINKLPPSSKIKLVGISQSKTSLATKKLAQQRAQVIADRFIEKGIASKRLVLATEITNYIDDNYLSHGVRIYAINKVKSTNITSNLNTKNTGQNNIENKQQALNRVIKQLKQSLEPASSDSATADKPIITKQSKDTCNKLNIETGSLKKNIQREISECGYLMGEWNFGTEEDYIDWLIPVAYGVDAENGIFGILKIIETNYQIRAHVHQMDMSIDFLPSIKRDKGQ